MAALLFENLLTHCTRIEEMQEFLPEDEPKISWRPQSGADTPGGAGSDEVFDEEEIEWLDAPAPKIVHDDRSMYGSFVNGFSSITSDLDISIKGCPDLSSGWPKNSIFATHPGISSAYSYIIMAVASAQKSGFLPFLQEDAELTPSYIGVCNIAFVVQTRHGVKAGHAGEIFVHFFQCYYDYFHKKKNRNQEEVIQIRTKNSNQGHRRKHGQNVNIQDPFELKRNLGDTCNTDFFKYGLRYLRKCEKFSLEEMNREKNLIRIEDRQTWAEEFVKKNVQEVIYSLNEVNAGDLSKKRIYSNFREIDSRSSSWKTL
uniref:Uncharacterized protein n=1 Tax=Ditylenchus dipsaci TaxID=166011 RepID=A0A915DR37_9BILA